MAPIQLLLLSPPRGHWAAAISILQTQLLHRVFIYSPWSTLPSLPQDLAISTPLSEDPTQQSHFEEQHRLRALRTLHSRVNPVPQGVGGTILWTCHEIYTERVCGPEYMGIACACLFAMPTNSSKAKFLESD